MQYCASRGGHAPGHLRDEFLECIDYAGDVWYEPLGNEDVLFFYSPAMQLRWDRMNLHERMLWITGQLWNCSDILPGLICSELELPQGSTYSRAVRKLRTEAAAEGGGTGDGRA